jgi:hypothetical protein
MTDVTCRVVEKITELVLLGVHGGALTQMVRDYGLKLRAADGVPSSSDCDCRYLPEDKTIRNVSQRAIHGQRLDPFDQAAVAKFIEREKAANPGTCWHFRPSDGQSAFLLVHQTPDQRRMLQVWGEGGVIHEYRNMSWGFTGCTRPDDESTCTLL